MIMENPLIPFSPVIKKEELDVEKIKLNYLREYNCDVSRFFQRMESISIMQCTKTGFRFYYPLQTEGDEQFYEALYDKHVEGLYSRSKWEFNEAIQQIEEGSRVLDIGGGGGAFISTLTKNKYVDALALEKNPFAISLLKNKGIKHSDENLNLFTTNNSGYFDVVTAFQVLEHVALPGEFIRSAVKLLRPGGKLIIAVPNSAPYYFKRDRYHTLNLPPHHMGLWNKAVLEKIATHFSLKKEMIICEPTTNALHYLSCIFNAQDIYMKACRTKQAKHLLMLLKILAYPARYLLAPQNILAIYSKA